jgi:cysteine desulfurase/selenocysteine lyase
VLSFLIDDIHPYDAGTILDRLGIAVRTGHHCTEPLMKRLDIPGTVRASFAFYNTTADADRLVEGLQKVKQMFG